MTDKRKDEMPDEKLTDAIEKGNEALAWYTSDNYPETSTCYINSGTLKTLIRASSTPSAEVQTLAELHEIIPATPLHEGMTRDIVADAKRLVARRPSADVKALRFALGAIIASDGAPKTIQKLAMDALGVVK